MIENLSTFLSAIFLLVGVFALCVVVGAGLAFGVYWVRSKIPHQVNYDVYFGDKKKEKK